jgi:hypothetical protein
VASRMSFLLQRAPVARASVDLRVAPHRRHDYAWHVICGGDVIRLANSLVVISSRDAPTRLVRDGIGASKIIGKRRLREMQNVMIDTAAIRLTETILGDEAPDLEETLKAIAANIGVLHIAYAPLSVQKGNDVNLLSAICTYPMAWQSRYFLKQYARIDPVLARGNEAVLPFDWDELPRDDPAIEAFFDDAAEHQLGRNGLGIPVRDRKGMRSLVSFTSDHSKNGGLRRGEPVRRRRRPGEQREGQNGDDQQHPFEHVADGICDRRINAFGSQRHRFISRSAPTHAGLSELFGRTHRLPASAPQRIDHPSLPATALRIVTTLSASSTQCVRCSQAKATAGRAVAQR